jgi:hypothetical protein
MTDGAQPRLRGEDRRRPRRAPHRCADNFGEIRFDLVTQW